MTGFLNETHGYGNLSNQTTTIGNVSEDTDMGTEELEQFQFYAWGVVANIIVFLGIVGNILSIIVLNHRWMRSSTSCYLTALAIFDTLLLISMSLFLALPTIKDLDDYNRFYPYMHPVAYPLSLIVQTCTIYTTVAFTIERYIAVCRPLYSTVVCTIPRARKGIVAIVVGAIIYNIPRTLQHEIVQVYSEEYNTTIPMVQMTEFGRNETFKRVYFIYLNMFVFFIIPFFTILVLNVLLIRAVRKSYRTHQKMNSKANKETMLTVMIIALVIVFLICQFPAIIDNIFLAILPEKEQLTSWYFRFMVISNLMVVVNSATNFIIYCLFGNKFRSVFVRVFCPCLRSKLKRQRTFGTSLQSRNSVMNGRSLQCKRRNIEDSSPEHNGTITPKQCSSFEKLNQVRDSNSNCSTLAVAMKQWRTDKNPKTMQERHTLLGKNANNGDMS